MVNNKNNLIVLGIFLTFLMIDIVDAQSVKLELCSDNGAKCYSYNENIRVNYNNYLILKATIINEENSWMCWDGLSYRFDIVSNKFTDGKKWVSASIFDPNQKEPKFCLSNNAKESTSFYIPLRDYNSMDNDSKLGNWQIDSFKFSFTNLQYYVDSRLSNPIYRGFSSNNEFVGNTINFVVDMKEPKKIWFGGINSDGARFTLGAIGILLLGISGSLWFLILTSNKRKKPWILTIFLTLITLILAYFGFTN